MKKEELLNLLTGAVESINLSQKFLMGNSNVFSSIDKSIDEAKCKLEEINFKNTLKANILKNLLNSDVNLLNVKSNMDLLKGNSDEEYSNEVEKSINIIDKLSKVMNESDDYEYANLHLEIVKSDFKYLINEITGGTAKRENLINSLELLKDDLKKVPDYFQGIITVYQDFFNKHSEFFSLLDDYDVNYDSCYASELEVDGLNAIINKSEIIIKLKNGFNEVERIFSLLSSLDETLYTLKEDFQEYKEDFMRELKYESYEFIESDEKESMDSYVYAGTGLEELINSAINKVDETLSMLNNK